MLKNFHLLEGFPSELCNVITVLSWADFRLKNVVWMSQHLNLFTNCLIYRWWKIWCSFVRRVPDCAERQRGGEIKSAGCIEKDQGWSDSEPEGTVGLILWRKGIQGYSVSFCLFCLSQLDVITRLLIKSFCNHRSLDPTFILFLGRGLHWDPKNKDVCAYEERCCSWSILHHDFLSRLSGFALTKECCDNADQPGCNSHPTLTGPQPMDIAPDPSESGLSSLLSLRHGVSEEETVGLHSGPGNMMLAFSLENMKQIIRDWSLTLKWVDLHEDESMNILLHKMTSGVVCLNTTHNRCEKIPQSCLHFNKRLPGGCNRFFSDGSSAAPAKSHQTMAFVS